MLSEETWGSIHISRVQQSVGDTEYKVGNRSVGMGKDSKKNLAMPMDTASNS